MIGYYPINPGGTDQVEDTFGAGFFRTHFFDRMRKVCEIDDTTPILEVQLTTGQVIDVSHIEELKPDYMLVSAFLDSRDCERTFQTYIRYVTIYRINMSTRPVEERAIGFTPHEPAAEEETVKAKKTR